MINWDMFTVKNILIVGVLALVAIFIFNYFSKKGDA